MSNPKPVPVLIVGGGPVGLALANDLGQRGIECLVIEREAAATASSRPDGVVGWRGDVVPSPSTP